MLLFASLLTALTVHCALAELPTSRSPYAVKERHHVPHGWSKVGDAPAQNLIALRIALRQGNFEDLESSLLEGKEHGFARSGPRTNNVIRSI
jgi:tripeptidyl-peptidase-1